MFQGVRRLLGREPTGDGGTNPGYVTVPPSAQAQLDLFRGEWTSAVPVSGEDTISGPRDDLFDDPRIAWMLAQLGPDPRWRVLELGPLEAGHTWMLEQAGLRDIVAIEAHARAFLRCLTVKNLLDLRARFLLGDFLAYLRRTEEHFDLCVASGVLYHMTNPLELLALMGARADRVFLWTHYHDADVLARRPDVAARFSGTARIEHGDLSCLGHRYEYREGRALPTFCGGAAPYSHWISRADILDALRRIGLGRIAIGTDEPDRDHGPAIALLATRD